MTPDTRPTPGSETARPARFTRAGAWLAALLPVLLAVWWVPRFWVDVPLWDDFERGPLLAKAQAGELRLGDLAAAHIQHRMLVPRTVTLALNPLTGGDLRAELAVNLGVIALTALGAGWLAARSLGHRPAGLFAGFLVAGLLASLMQYQTYLWVTAMGIVIPGACLVTALWLWQRPWGTPARLVACILCASAAALSFGHGVLVAPALLPLLLFSSRCHDCRGRLLVIWCVWIAVEFTLYFHRLENVAHPAHSYFGGASSTLATNLETFRTQPSKLPLFFLGLLGSPLARGFVADPRAPGYAIGGSLLLGFAVLSLAGLAMSRRRPELREALVPWLCLGTFAILGAAAVAWGRSGFEGSNRAFTPRYINITQHLAASVLVMVPLLLGHARWSPRMAPLGWTAGGIVLAVIALQWIEGGRLARAWWEGRLQGRAQLALLPHVRPSTTRLLDGDLKFLVQQATFLDRSGWFDPPLLKTPYLEAFPVSRRPLDSRQAAIESCEEQADSWVIRGFARVPAGGRPADAVVLCSKEPAGWRIRAVADPVMPRGNQRFNLDYEFTSYHQPGYRPQPGWICHLPRPVLEAAGPDAEWSAWVLDARRWRVARIPGEIRVGTRGPATEAALVTDATPGTDDR